MNITVTVDDVSADSVLDGVGYDYDAEGEPVRRADTIGDRVVAEIVRRAMADGSGYFDGLSQRVARVRDEEILARVRPLITEALTKPVRPTNAYGEHTGPETSLSSLIMDEVKAMLTHKADRYSGNKTVLQAIVAEEVKKAFTDVVAAEVKAAKDAVTAEIGSQVAGGITDTIKRALR